jgi:phosphonate transport system ATP-binding protein
MSIVRASQVQKVYPNGTRALRGVSFEVQPGEGVILLGPNGSGKSTLLRTLIGLEHHDAGEVTVDGVSLGRARGAELRRLRSRVGMVFQKFHLMPGMTAFQNVLLGALGRRSIVRLTSMTASDADRRDAMRCLERVGLAELASQRADTMSGGQQQRIAVARMLMQRPKIVLADEPIASLDPRAGKEIMDLLWAIVREDNLTVICTLHQLDIALEYGERIIGLRAGEKVIDAPVRDLDHATLSSLYLSPEPQGAIL